MTAPPNLRDNPLTPDLTAEQLRLRRKFTASLEAGLAGLADPAIPLYLHDTELWYPGTPDTHLAGFATPEDRDAYVCHAPGPFLRVRRAPVGPFARFLRPDPVAAAEPAPEPEPTPEEREQALVKLARDKIRRFLTHGSPNDVWTIEDAVWRVSPARDGEIHGEFRDRAADLLVAAGWRVGYTVADASRLLAKARKQGAL